jgi:hypothetical protein
LHGAVPFNLQLVFFLPLWTKAGVMRQWDVSSHQKLTVDAVAEALGVDDRYCVTLSLQKVDAERSWTQIAVDPLFGYQRG